MVLNSVYNGILSIVVDLGDQLLVAQSPRCTQGLPNKNGLEYSNGPIRVNMYCLIYGYGTILSQGVANIDGLE